MQMRAQKESWKGNEELEPRVFVEILWDIEQITEDGRRRGERMVTSIWWRAQVLTVSREDTRTRVQLRYDSRDGFKGQVGEVWVFPRHVQLVGDESTQLRWRYYECSGDIEYAMGDEPVTDVHEVTEDVGGYFSSPRVEALEELMGLILHQYESLEQMVLSQNMLFSRLVGTGSKSDRVSAQVLHCLSQKLALLMQKPISPLNSRKESEEGNSYYEDSCAGYLSVDVDCDLETFQAVARVVKSSVSGAFFRPSFGKTQCPPPNFDELEILFATFSDLAKVIGVSSSSDIVRMVSRERGSTKEGGIPGVDAAIRVIGTILVDESEEKSPIALLVCSSINERSLMKSVDSLIRDTLEFDFSSRAFRKHLQPRTCSGKELLKTVFASKLVSMAESRESDAIRAICSDLRSFTLRWRPICLPSTRLWTRSLAVSEFVGGIVELEVPFLIFRGPESVVELKEFVTESFIMQQLREDGVRDADVSG